jgi:hypothetical protein
MSSRLSLLACFLATGALALGASELPAYRKLQLSDTFLCEGSTLADLNRDGKPDVVAGPYWYEGPDFKTRHEIYPAATYDAANGYSENFFAFGHDFNGDGWTDVLVIGFPGVDASWFENPGTSGAGWKRHVVFLPVDNESPTFGDLLGTKQPVLVCMSRGRIGYATWNPKSATTPWTFHPISPQGPWQRFTHGLGFGDVNGDGRNDILEKDGWWEQPASLDKDPEWKQHRFPFAAGGRGGAQMYVYDVNGDGKPDVIGARDAHGFGLSWFEQTGTDASGEITFREHRITSPQQEEKIGGVQFAQPHALAMADFDGDGLLDLVTGKRWWAHGPKGDVDAQGPAVLYVFTLRRAGGEATFEPHRIDDASGIGTQVFAADTNGDGRPDIVSANKRGTFIFLSESPSAKK